MAGASASLPNPITHTDGGVGVAMPNKTNSIQEYTHFKVEEAVTAVSAKLVRRIPKAEFVDMSELLKNNLEAERRRMLDSSKGRPTTSKKLVGGRSHIC